jgi:hypothetical protein
MITARLEAFERLKHNIETATLKKEFADKKPVLLKLAAVCTGCSDVTEKKPKTETTETAEIVDPKKLN